MRIRSPGRSAGSRRSDRASRATDSRSSCSTIWRLRLHRLPHRDLAADRRRGPVRHLRYLREGLRDQRAGCHHRAVPGDGRRPDACLVRGPAHRHDHQPHAPARRHRPVSFVSTPHPTAARPPSTASPSTPRSPRTSRDAGSASGRRSVQRGAVACCSPSTGCRTTERASGSGRSRAPRRSGCWSPGSCRSAGAARRSAWASCRCRCIASRASPSTR